jgi:hypothetical protein
VPVAEQSIPAQIMAASAAGDAATLGALAIELLQQLATAEATLAQLRRAEEERREGTRERKRRSREGAASRDVTRGHVTSRDETGQAVTSRDVTRPSPPSPPLLPPTPPNNSSTPPSPLPPRPPANDEEQRLHDRAPEAWPVIARFLTGKEPVAAIAWIGRFQGALDRPPHPTGVELRDALEDLMTQPAEDWKPTLFRRYVERIRSDADGAAARRVERIAAAEAASAPITSSADAGTMFARIRELVQVAELVPGQPRRRFIRRADVEQLGERVLRAYDEIGGADRFLDPDEKVGFVLRDFSRAYGTLAGATP